MAVAMPLSHYVFQDYRSFVQLRLYLDGWFFDVDFPIMTKKTIAAKGLRPREGYRTLFWCHRVGPQIAR